MFIQKLFSNVRANPLELVTGLLIMSAVIAGASVKDVSSGVIGLLLIISLIYIASWKTTWQSLSFDEKLVLVGLMLFTVSGFIAYLNVEDQYEYVKHMGRYLRFTLFIPVYLFVVKSEFNLSRYFNLGLVISGPVFLIIALTSTGYEKGLPAAGHYHHIVFGDGAMINALLMMTLLAFRKFSWNVRALIVISSLCAIYASVLSQARGAWVALPIGVIIMLSLLAWQGRIKLKYIAVFVLFVVVVISVAPARQIIQSRFNDAVSDISLFMSEEKFNTSVGTRLVMWDVAFQVWKEQPLLGTGPGDFDNDLVEYIKDSKYRNVGIHADTHNVFVQTLVTTGIVGFVIFCLSFIALPLRYFFRNISKSDSLESAYGLMFIVAFTVFGLSATWFLRAPVVSLFLVYLVVIMSQINRKEQQEQAH